MDDPKHDMSCRVSPWPISLYSHNEILQNLYSLMKTCDIWLWSLDEIFIIVTIIITHSFFLS